MTFCWQDGGRRDNVSLPSAQYDEMVALPMLFVMFYQLRTTLKCFLTTKCIPWSSSITMYQLTSNHQLCHFIFPQLLTSCWTSLPSFLISLNGSYISTPSFFSPTFITCISIHSVPLLQCSNDSPFSLWSIPELEAGGTQKCRIVHSILWRIFKLSDAVWRYATYQLLQRLLLIYTSQNVYMPCLLLHLIIQFVTYMYIISIIIFYNPPLRLLWRIQSDIFSNGSTQVYLSTLLSHHVADDMSSFLIWQIFHIFSHLLNFQWPSWPSIVTMPKWWRTCIIFR